MRTQWECSYRSGSKRSLLCPHLPLLEFRIIESVVCSWIVCILSALNTSCFWSEGKNVYSNFVPEEWKFVKAKRHLQGQVTIFGKIHNTNFLTFSIRAVHTATITPADRFCQRSVNGVTATLVCAHSVWAASVSQPQSQVVGPQGTCGWKWAYRLALSTKLPTPVTHVRYRLGIIKLLYNYWNLRISMWFSLPSKF